MTGSLSLPSSSAARSRRPKARMTTLSKSEGVPFLSAAFCFSGSSAATKLLAVLTRNTAPLSSDACDSPAPKRFSLSASLSAASLSLRISSRRAVSSAAVSSVSLSSGSRFSGSAASASLLSASSVSSVSDSSSAADGRRMIVASSTASISSWSIRVGVEITPLAATWTPKPARTSDCWQKAGGVSEMAALNSSWPSRPMPNMSLPCCDSVWPQSPAVDCRST